MAVAICRGKTCRRAVVKKMFPQVSRQVGVLSIMWTNLFPGVGQCLRDESRTVLTLPGSVVFAMGKLYWPQLGNTPGKTLESLDN
jgi:hypothetical protein